MEWINVWILKLPNGDQVWFHREPCVNQLTDYLKKYLPMRLSGTWSIRATRVKARTMAAIPFDEG